MTATGSGVRRSRGSWRVDAEQRRRAEEAAVLDALFAEVMGG